MDTLWGNKLIHSNILTMCFPHTLTCSEIPEADTRLAQGKKGDAMFYEVRVYNSQEELKNIISPQTLSKRHWKNYWEADNKLRLPSATNPNFLSIFLRVK